MLLLVMADGQPLSNEELPYEPMPRLWHTSTLTGQNILVQGGLTKEYTKEIKQSLASIVETFDTKKKLWQMKEVSGIKPAPGVRSAASAAVSKDLFLFGGFDGTTFYNSMHWLEDASEWFELCPQNKIEEFPMAKSGAKMVVINDSLVVFAGYGIPHGTHPDSTQSVIIQRGSSFIEDTRYDGGAGWTNELHVYNLKKGTYS